MINLDHISYWYPGREEPALHDVSLDIGDGESACLMGRNGSGKSTLFKLIAGMVEPGRGRIDVGVKFPGREAVTEEVAILFQNPDNQMVASLVEKEIAFGLENKAVPQAQMESAISSVAQQFGIETLLGRLTSELSDGEKQRVALASVMIHQPSILLLDEPDSFLDQVGRRLLVEELRLLHEQDGGLIELRITQSAEVARSYPRLVVLDQGEVLADGEPSRILADRELVGRAGLTVPDVSNLTLPIPDRLELRTEAQPEVVTEIRLEDVNFAWPMSPPVFERLNLSLGAGEVVGLVGPTGVGKSSLGMLMVGLMEPTDGTVSYYNSSGDRLTLNRIKGQTALVLQQPERQFFLDNCAREVDFGPSNLGRPLHRGEADSLFKMVGLDPARYAERDPLTLSAGEKRRLAFAAILSMAPSIVIFDEPTAGLDGDGIGRFICLSKALKQAGLGQMIISHDGDVIRHLADRVFYLTKQDSLRELKLEDLLESERFVGVISRPTWQD